MRKTLFLLPAALLIAGCGSNSDESATGTTTTTTAVAPSANACVASDLEASLADVNSPAGKFTIVLTSRDDDPCSLQGTPQAQLFEEDASIPTDQAASSTDSANVELNEGDQAFFDIDYQAEAIGVGQTADWIYITVPGDDQSLRLPLQGSQIGSVNDGVPITVSPIRATA